jgi:hypothetical protein
MFGSFSADANYHADVVDQVRLGVETLGDSVGSPFREQLAQHLYDVEQEGRFTNPLPVKRHAVDRLRWRTRELIDSLNTIAEIPSRNAARERLLKILTNDVDSLTPSDFRSIRTLVAELPDELRISTPTLEDHSLSWAGHLDNAAASATRFASSNFRRDLASLRMDASIGTREEAVARALQLLNRPNELLTHDELLELRALSFTGPERVRTGAPRHVDGSLPLDKDLRTAAYRETPATLPGDALQNLANLRVHLSITTKAAARDRVAEIVQRDPLLVSADDLRDLRALVVHAPSRRGVSLRQALKLADPRWRDTYSTVLELGDKRMDSAILAIKLGYSGASNQRARAALRHLESQPEFSGWTALLWSHLAEQHPQATGTAGMARLSRSIDEQVRRSGNVDAALYRLRSDLELLQQLAGHHAAKTGDPQVDDLALEIATLVQRNVDRIDGVRNVTDNGKKGFRNFPDFGEISQATSAAQLIHALNESANATPVARNGVAW